MQEFIGAMVRFSTALTIYGIQQVRHGVNELVSSPMTVDRMREAMDSATNSLRTKIDESQKTAFNSATTFSDDFVAKTCETVRNSVPDASEMLRNTGDVLRRSAEKYSSVFRSNAAAQPAEQEAQPEASESNRSGRRGRSGEPQPAADVL